MTDRKTVTQNNSETINVTHKETIKAARFEIVVDQIEKNGDFFPYSYINMKSGVVILPFVGNRICAIRQFRPTLGDWIYELPAGAIEKGETPKDAAVRELFEEVGCRPVTIHSLGDTYASTGCTNEHVYLFAMICEETTDIDQDDSEIIEKELMNRSAFLKLIREGKLKCATNELAWHRYMEKSDEWGF